MKIITTSWDDGNELDFKLADLLSKYNLKATFYIPRSNAERSVMHPSQIQELAKAFEIGGHTINHVRLRGKTKVLLEKEVGGSFQWLKDLIGMPPVSFCFPGGEYDTAALNSVFSCGYQLARTTELYKIKINLQYRLASTTLQVYTHSTCTYIKHLLKRKRISSLTQWLLSATGADIEKLTVYFLQQIEKKNGCFHLWGHSWEIQEYNLWHKLEKIFKILAFQPGFQYIDNRQLLTVNGQSP